LAATDKSNSLEKIIAATSNSSTQALLPTCLRAWSVLLSWERVDQEAIFEQTWISSPSGTVCALPVTAEEAKDLTWTSVLSSPSGTLTREEDSLSLIFQGTNIMDPSEEEIDPRPQNGSTLSQ